MSPSADNAAAAILHERGHVGSIVLVTSLRFAVAGEHMVRRLHVPGDRPNTVCTLYTCTLTYAHTHDICARAGAHLTLTLQYFRAQTTTSLSSSSLPSRCSPPPCLAVSAASFSAADASPTDTTPYGLSALKGALAAASSAQCGELRRSRERHPRQGCQGRARCEGSGSRAPRRGYGARRPILFQPASPSTGAAAIFTWSAAVP